VLSARVSPPAWLQSNSHCAEPPATPASTGVSSAITSAAGPATGAVVCFAADVSVVITTVSLVAPCKVSNPVGRGSGMSLTGIESGLRDPNRAGGANTSHTISLVSLQRLLAAVPPDATLDSYREAAVVDNALAKNTDGARIRTFRYLRELYALSPDVLVFRALRDLWDLDEDAQPLLAVTCAVARDPVLRASASAVVEAVDGQPVGAKTLAAAVTDHFPERYNEGIANKIGRNAASSWTQSGHLVGRTRKVRTCATCKPVNVTYALLVGHLAGARGMTSFTTIWAHLLDRSEAEMRSLAATASRQGLMEYKSAGDVVELGYRHLMRPVEQPR